MTKLFLNRIRRVRAVIVTIVGFSVTIIGILMIVLPGPAFVVIPLGLGILATEFVWARKLLIKVKSYVHAKRTGGISDEAE